MNVTKIIFSLHLFLMVVVQRAYSQNIETDADIVITLIKEVKPERMIDEIRDFASPAFEGRELGTGGNAKASNWVDFKFQEIGLLPLVNYDEFKHGFPIYKYKLGTNNRINFSNSKRSYVSPDVSPAVWGVSSTISAPIISSGKGDYVGKIVLFPIPKDKAFNEETFLYLHKKSLDFHASGALGIIFIWQNNFKDGVNLYRFEDFVEIPLLAQKNITNTSKPFVNLKTVPIPIFFVNELVGKELIKSENNTVEMTTDFAVEKESMAYSVIGMLPGKYDRIDKATIVVASMDQEGFNSVNGTPYLGANTNASAIVALLEMARVFKSSKSKPRYPIIFIALNGTRRVQSGLTHLKSIHEYQLFKSSTWIYLESLGYTTAEEDITHAIINIESPITAIKKLPYNSVKRPRIEATIDSTFSGNQFEARNFVSIRADYSPYDNRIIDAQNKLNYITLYRLVQLATDITWRLNHLD